MYGKQTSLELRGSTGSRVSIIEWNCVTWCRTRLWHKPRFHDSKSLWSYLFQNLESFKFLIVWRVCCCCFYPLSSRSSGWPELPKWAMLVLNLKLSSCQVLESQVCTTMLSFIHVFIFWARVLVGSSGWPGTVCVAPVVLELARLLSARSKAHITDIWLLSGLEKIHTEHMFYS